MSVRVMSAVWEISLPDSEKLVLLALADCANDEGHCWPSMATLAKKCSKSDRTVQASIKSLCDRGHLTRNEVRGKGCNYLVHPRSDCTPEVAAPPKPVPPEAPSPPKGTTLTPEAASDKPSRTINLPSEGARAKGWHRLPEDWQPRPLPAATQAKADLWPPGELDDELEALRNWARNAEDKNGRGRKLDWDAAWVNWVNRHDRERRPQRGGRSSPANDMDAAMRDLGFGR